MKCPNCGTDNREQTKFCRSCGKQLEPSLPAPAQTAPAPKPAPAPAEFRIGPYRALGLWRSGSTIYWVVPANKSPDVTVPRCLAVQIPRALSSDLLKNLRALSESGPFLAHVVGQTNDSQRHWYLILDHVEGGPLDTFNGKMDTARATKVFEKMLKSIIYLHDHGWAIARKRPREDTDWRTRILGFLGLGNGGAQGIFSSGEDPILRCEQAFAIDSLDNPILFDYTVWEPVTAWGDERDERIQRDMRVAVSMLYQLMTGGHLTKELDSKLRQAPDKINQFIINVLQEAYPTFRELGETFSKIVQAPDPGKTLPVPAAVQSATTRRLPLTKLSSTAMTDTGKVREHNEDNCFAQPMGAAGGIFVVADGMGGHSAGEVASKMAIDEIYKGAVAQWATVENTVLPDDVRQIFQAWIKNANAKIFAEAQTRNNNMGTTLTAALVVNGMVYAANVGDSRTYLFRSGQLYPLTHDHSLVASLVQAGILKPEEIYTHPQRNEIFRALGQQRDLNVDVFPPQTLGHEDRLVLCSDGLWEMVRPPQFENILKANPDPPQACAELIKAANEHGGEDNITIVIVRVTFE